jgi:hypothetical protein
MNQYERIQQRRNAYRRLFLDNDGKLTPDAQVVMLDLGEFCRVLESPAVTGPNGIDTHATLLSIGRLEVFRRFGEHLDTSDADLIGLQRMYQSRADDEPG